VTDSQQGPIVATGSTITPQGGNSPDLAPGTYHLRDGSVLTVQKDGLRIIVSRAGKRTVQDRFGNVVDTGDPNAGKGRTSLGDSGKTKTEDRSDAAAKAKVDAAAAADAAAKNTPVYNANQELGYVWVDGKQMKVVKVGDDGAYTVQVDGGKPGPMTTTTAFGALDSSAIDGGARFTMNYGQGDIFDGQAAGQHAYTPQGVGATGAAGEHSQSANQVGNTTNMMTIQSGLQWLANLATTDHEAYGAMVDRLHKAGYLSDQAYAAAGSGTYSSIVGGAFADAARDTAVINSTPNGFHTRLDDVLDQRIAGVAAAKAAAYKPVARNYTDPEAVKASARSAAESALGRQLTPEEESRLTAHFHSLESTAYDQVDAAGRQDQNASVTNPSVPGQVNSFINDNNAQEQANFATSGYGRALMNLFGVKA
jgi:hypothetical protein